MRKFMRTRSAAPLPANGHAKGAAGAAGAADARDDQLSASSRYWSGSSGAASGGAGGALWEDREFPPEAALRARGVVWLRPHELCARPRFLGDAAREDAPPPPPPPSPPPPSPPPGDQLVPRWGAEGAGGAGAGAALGVAAAALAAGAPRLLARAVPPHSFRRDYTGAVRFRFWVFGEWRDVVVDDRLPARRAPAGRAPRPLFARAAAADDFTLPLLEKAYAKLYGSYAASRAEAGGAARALQELSGGVVQSFAPPRQPRALLLRVLAAALPRATLLVASAAPREGGCGRRLRGGLLAGRAYLVAGLAGGPGGALVRLRAADARGAWTGAPGRPPPAPPDRDAPPPGHFWMPFEEFASAFSRLELVHVGPDDWLREPALHRARPWRAVLARRRWRHGYNAGGPPHSPTAYANPQFQLSVPEGAGCCHVVVSVTQQYAPAARARLSSVGFAVYELPADAAPRRPPLGPELPPPRALDVTHAMRAREVATFFTLPAGQYLVVPHARAHEERAFLLRVLTDTHTDLWEVNEDNAVVCDAAAGADAGADADAGAARVLRRVRGDEVDARQLRAALRGAGWGAGCGGGGGASLELCLALVALRDPGAAGRAAARALPALLALLAGWRRAWAAAAPRRRAASAYRLRAMLHHAGLTASNKVVECLVLRHARAGRLTARAFLLACARLHLAHERYRTLDSKLKSNPLSLEEMILMTIYS